MLFNFCTFLLTYCLIDDNKGGGIRKSELVAWYLDQIQEQIDSSEELLDRKNFIEKVIDRLIYNVCIDIFIYYIVILSGFVFAAYNVYSFFFLGSNYNTSDNNRLEKTRSRRRGG